MKESHDVKGSKGMPGKENEAKPFSKSKTGWIFAILKVLQRCKMIFYHSLEGGTRNNCVKFYISTCKNGWVISQKPVLHTCPTCPQSNDVMMTSLDCESNSLAFLAERCVSHCIDDRLLRRPKIQLAMICGGARPLPVQSAMFHHWKRDPFTLFIFSFA